MYYSELLHGQFTFNPDEESAKIEFESEALSLKSGYSIKGRGMELSDVIVFDGNILAADDRTGIVFKIIGKDVVPWSILADGDGLATTGFKCEWMTIKGTNFLAFLTICIGLVIDTTRITGQSLNELGTILYLHFNDILTNTC